MGEDVARDCQWREVRSAKHRIVDRYFHAAVREDELCDVFCIHGVPAACMLYLKPNGRVTVRAFFLNRGMLLLFDAGPHMRSALSERHKKINMTHAENGGAFLVC